METVSLQTLYTFAYPHIGNVLTSLTFSAGSTERLPLACRDETHSTEFRTIDAWRHRLRHRRVR